MANTPIVITPDRFAPGCTHPEDYAAAVGQMERVLDRSSKGAAMQVFRTEIVDWRGKGTVSSHQGPHADDGPHYLGNDDERLQIKPRLVEELKHRIVRRSGFVIDIRQYLDENVAVTREAVVQLMNDLMRGGTHIIDTQLLLLKSRTPGQGYDQPNSKGPFPHLANRAAMRTLLDSMRERGARLEGILFDQPSADGYQMGCLADPGLYSPDRSNFLGMMRPTGVIVNETGDEVGTHQERGVVRFNESGKLGILDKSGNVIKDDGTLGAVSVGGCHGSIHEVGAAIIENMDFSRLGHKQKGLVELSPDHTLPRTDTVWIAHGQFTPRYK